MPDFTIRDHPDKSRYEMIVGGTLAGYVRYCRSEGMITLTRTRCEPYFEDGWTSSRLIRFALDDARRRGVSVVAMCPTVRGWIARHPDYQDVTTKHSRLSV